MQSALSPKWVLSRISPIKTLNCFYKLRPTEHSTCLMYKMETYSYSHSHNEGGIDQRCNTERDLSVKNFNRTKFECLHENGYSVYKKRHSLDAKLMPFVSDLAISIS